MIQYTADDIIEKALALSDLQNSDFIGYKEKIQFLNDAYVSMFNKMIDYGDNLFTIEVQITDTEVELPSDFYQLREVFIMNNNVKTLVTPKPLNQSHNDLSYEIKNNVLYLYGKYSGNAYYSYYSTPQTLIVEPPKKTVNIYGADTSSQITVVENDMLNRPKRFISGFGEKYLNTALSTSYLRTFSDSTKVKSISGIGGATSPSAIAPIFKYFNGQSYGFINSLNQQIYGVSYAKMISGYSENGIDTISSISNYGHNIAIVNKEMYAQQSDGLYKYMSFYDLYERKVEATLDVTNETDFAKIRYYPYGLDEDLCIIFTYNTFTIGVNGEEKSFADYLADGETIEQFFINDNDKSLPDSVVFVTSMNRIFALNIEYGEPNLIKEVPNDYDIVTLLGFDPDSGYGILCYDFFEETFVILSGFDTTELSFPNNTYFSIIAYNLAILFCQKQNKDTTQLRVELERQENIFYDSLHRDETSFRITNTDTYMGSY